MAELGYGKTLRLHLPPASDETPQTAWNDYDFSYNPRSGYAVAWLGHHMIAAYNPNDGTMIAPVEVQRRLRVWGNAQASWRDDDRVVLTPTALANAFGTTTGGRPDGANDRV